MSLILELSSYYSIVLSAAVAITYTLLGGLYSVAYTDVIQLFFIFLSLALGGLSYQALYQRILSAASPLQAQITCFLAAGLVLILAVPSIIIGAVASTTDWNQTAYGLPSPFDRGEAGKVLPLALHYLTPSWVSVVGIGGLAAAVMSSMDSVLLSSASMFARNIYKNSLRVKASDRECLWVIRVSVLLVGLAGMCLAFRESSVLALWLVSGDLIYVTIFPQLICVLYCRRANGYGAVTGLVLSTALRGLSGEPLLSLPPVLLFPGWRRDPDSGAVSQYFPFRTAIMLLAMLSIPAVSLLARQAFARRLLPASWDVMGALQGAEGPPAGRKGEGGEEEEEEEEVEEGEARAVPSAKENLLALSSACPLGTSGRPESC